MRRAAIIGLTLAAVAWSFGAPAQHSTRLREVAVFYTDPSSGGAEVDAFRRGLAELGWREGENLVIDVRWTRGDPALAAEAATDFARRKVDVILAPGSSFVAAAKAATSTIPIVFCVHGDPIGTGDVASLARPGGNITGVAQVQSTALAKEVELLKEAVPTLRRLAILWNVASPTHRPGLDAIEAASRSLHIESRRLQVEDAGDLASIFSRMRDEQVDAALVLTAPLFLRHEARIVELALVHKMPTVAGLRSFADAGGLMSYGANFPALFHRAAALVDKILKGASPADLPVEEPSKLELVVNLKTARVLRLDIPASILARADEVIE